MKRNRYGAIAAVLATASLTLSACAANEASAGSPSSSSLSGTLNGIGSSAQATAETTWIAGFQKEHSAVTVNYDPQGSGAGRKSFISGAAEFAGSDVALSADELESTFKSCAPDSKAIDLPVYISPIAIVYNVDGLKDLKLDAKTIADIFKGTITAWDDPAITAMNPDAALPSGPITVVHRSDDSGTTQNFTEYLSANAPDVWDAEPSQTYPYKVGDAAKGTSGVADAVKNARNSIAYLDESGAGDLDIAQLKVGDSFVTISADGAAAVVAASPTAKDRPDNDLAIDIDRTDTQENAWPLVLVSYMIACQTYADEKTADLVKAYASYVASEAAQQAAAESAGSAPLAKELADKVMASIDTIK